MNRELSQRLARALDVGDATVEQRQAVAAAAQTAGTFEDLPADVQVLVLRLERAGE